MLTDRRVSHIQRSSWFCEARSPKHLLHLLLLRLLCPICEPIVADQPISFAPSCPAPLHRHGCCLEQDEPWAIFCNVCGTVRLKMRRSGHENSDLTWVGGVGGGSLPGLHSSSMILAHERCFQGSYDANSPTVCAVPSSSLDSLGPCCAVPIIQRIWFNRLDDGLRCRS